MQSWQVLNLADCGVIIGLGGTLSPYTVRLDNGRIVVRLGWHLAERQALAVWDAVQLATQSCNVLVVNGDGSEVTR